MPQMQNTRPEVAGPGTGIETAGEHVPVRVTDLADIAAVAVPVWIRRRGGDPVTTRRRIAARLDDLLGIDRTRSPEPYAAGGMTLGYFEREAAA